MRIYQTVPDEKEILRRIENCRHAGGTRLDLSHLQITDLLDEIREFGSLTDLNVSYNQLESLPDWIGDFSALKFLNLRHCGLKSLPESMKNLSNLHTLYLGANRLPALPEWLGDLTQLEKLDIGANELYSIPEFVGKLQNLTELNLGHSGEWENESYEHTVNHLDRQINELDKLPEFLTALPKLKRLNLGHTALKSLSEDLSILRLEYLSLSNNELTTIPEWLGEMTSLIEHNLSGNEKLKALPHSFSMLCNLEAFDISVTALNKVPECIRYYKKLKKLSIGGIYMEPMRIFKFTYDVRKSIVIPKWIGELTNLECLYPGLWVAKIPESIGSLRNLRRIDIWGSKIKTLPWSFCELSSLKELSIGCCEYLKKLPESFCNLPSLEKLELSDCTKIKRLPDSFGNLKTLKELSLSDFYNLETLPDSFGNLPSLRKLYIYGCLGYLPESFCKL